MNYVIRPPLSAGRQITSTAIAHRDLKAPMARNFPSGWFNVNATGRIEGYIYERSGETDVPIQRKLFLIRDEDAMRMRMKYSDPVTGYYSFEYLEMGYTYSVIAHDVYQTRNAVIKDKIAPTPM